MKMFTNNNIILSLGLFFCLFSSALSATRSAISEKYAPYIGYEHGFISVDYGNSLVMKYVPRFYLGFRPIQEKNYQIGLETGITFPTTYENKHYDVTRSKKIQNSDFYATFYQPLTKNCHWFLKSGLEYQRNIQETRYEQTYYGHYYKTSYYSYHNEEQSLNSVFLSSKAGIGYHFNNGVEINLVSGTRFVDFNHNNRPKKFLFTSNIQYSF